jgi:hypothetical protein
MSSSNARIKLVTSLRGKECFWVSLELINERKNVGRKNEDGRKELNKETKNIKQKQEKQLGNNQSREKRNE